MKGLSKSRYTRFCQCPKGLWLKLYRPELEETDEALQSRFEQGTEAGDLAMSLLGDYVDVTSYKEDGSLDLPAMIEKTHRELEKGTENICEASFSFNKNGISHYCAVDILHKEREGWSIYEVKSSSYTSDKKDTEKSLSGYIRDIAYQKWVLGHCGIKVVGTYLVRLDANYMRDGELDLCRLFNIKDMRNFVEKEYAAVSDNVSRISSVISGEEPEVRISGHCQSPHECGFLKYCTGDMPKPNVFDLYRMNFSKKCEHYHQGRICFKDLKNEKLSKVQKMQVRTYLDNIQHIKPDRIKEFLEQLSFPIYFLDFETMLSPIPPFDHTRPYQQIPFQYSLHRIDSNGGELTHTEFLGNSVDDPRRKLAEQLCRDIPEKACVTAYNKIFECHRIEEMAEMFPDLKNHLLTISNNIIDLIEPFREQMIYLPAMNGSFSIKKVLPVLFPDNPELDYSNLSGSVHHGGEAMKIYPAIAEMSPDEAEEARRSLLEYCKLDTLAMVRIWEKLREYADYEPV